MGEREWVIRKPALGPTRLRLFCLPHAGGGAAIYRDWHAALPVGVEVCRLQLPGREERIGEPAFSDMDGLMGALLPALRSWLDHRFVLFGHSMGALIAYELAVRLQAEGKPPEELVVAGVRPPQLEKFSPIHHLSDAAFIAAIRQRGGTPEAVLDDRELMGLLLPLLRADFRLAEGYVRRSPTRLERPILCLAGRDDEEASPEEMRRWQACTNHELRSETFPGGHFFVRSHWTQVAAVLSRRLAHHLRNHLPGPADAGGSDLELGGTQG